MPNPVEVGNETIAKLKGKAMRPTKMEDESQATLTWTWKIDRVQYKAEHADSFATATVGTYDVAITGGGASDPHATVTPGAQAASAIGKSPSTAPPPSPTRYRRHLDRRHGPTRGNSDGAESIRHATGMSVHPLLSNVVDTPTAPAPSPHEHSRRPQEGPPPAPPLQPRLAAPGRRPLRPRRALESAESTAAPARTRNPCLPLPPAARSRAARSVTTPPRASSSSSTPAHRSLCSRSSSANSSPVPPAPSLLLCRRGRPLPALPCRVYLQRLRAV